MSNYPLSGQKRCPRCHGHLYLEAEISGDEVVCLQCGFRRAIQLRRAA